VPGTLRGLILARFDQLPPDLRHTLQQAAVLGRSFPARLLEKLHNRGMEGVLAHLTELTNRQFLQEDTNSSELGFSFRHTLIQEAVYTTLLKRERRRLHGLVAEVIKDTNFWLPEEQAEALAYHYSESSDPDKAIPYLIAAADNATPHPLFKAANSHSRLSYQQ
jgi:predicted ATPase